MDEEDRKIIAYHEAGHAIVQAVVDDGLLPIHKVTIIPRGQSLGSTMFTPKKDILNHSKRRVLNQVCCAMGGRAAEEIEIGDVTSGAAGDIRMATNIARSMVCDWGMSELGMISFGDKQDQVFLGKNYPVPKTTAKKRPKRLTWPSRKSLMNSIAEQSRFLPTTLMHSMHLLKPSWSMKLLRVSTFTKFLSMEKLFLR